MHEKYSQLKAASYIAKASLTATLRSPTSVVFSLLFPIIFVVVFGAMVDNTAIKIKMVVLSQQKDTSQPLLKAVKAVELFDLSFSPDSVASFADLKKGRISGILKMQSGTAGVNQLPHYSMDLFTSDATTDKLPLIQAALESVTTQINKRWLPGQPSIVEFKTNHVAGRKYRPIDFILPGQLGFSLLMAGVFGSAFLLFSLRNTMVLKRIFAAPINPFSYLLGEMVSRLLFQVICFIVIVAIGHYAFHFTLVNGLLTFMEMLLLSVPGLIIFTGIGFFISGIIRNESSIAPVANTITVPQILLCGLFFPIDNYPQWLHSFCELLPLTFLVDGLRKIAFEGAHIWQIPYQVSGLLTWAIIIILICLRSFKWE